VTLAENIARQSASLPVTQQRKVLRFVESLARTQGRHTRKTPNRELRGVHPALKPVVGIWAARTDLPDDAVDTVRTLRRQSAERRRNG
jgi:hypothetical protein